MCRRRTTGWCATTRCSRATTTITISAAIASPSRSSAAIRISSARICSARDGTRSRSIPPTTRCRYRPSSRWCAGSSPRSRSSTVTESNGAAAGLPLSYLIIFLTGAATLALELLSSRVLTPYFGVSLYIWSSILSITLTFLAVGYYCGGRLARRTESASRHFAFFAAPAISALAIVGACLIYPSLFPWLAGIDLVFGSIMAATVLLAIPLVVLSAMNPLLIAMRPEEAGDAGAGRVFFVSTLGSVAGVAATAFLLIPNVTNFRALLLLAIVLALLPTGGAASASAPRQRRGLVAAAAVGLALAGGLFALASAYLHKTSDLFADGYRFRLRAEYS